MNIIGTDIEEKQRKSKKTMITIIILLIILAILSVGLVYEIYELKGKQFKFIIDGKAIPASIYTGLFEKEGEEIYFSIKDIAPLISYEFFNGEYKTYNEDTDFCYAVGKNEIATFQKDKDIIYKTPKDKADYTYFRIDKQIKKINGKLYISSEGLKTAFNLQFENNTEKNTMQINTLPYIVQMYKKAYSNASLGNFNNQKALLYGLLVVQNVDNTEETRYSMNARYGVNTLENEEIIGMKYEKIEYVEGSDEFIVTIDEQKVGIITSEGKTKISPDYKDIKQIDKDLNMYLVVATDGKKGILDKRGAIIAYPEYDQIGVDIGNTYSNTSLKNKYILFNNAIPVKKNKKWGLIDTHGTVIVPIQYNFLGCDNRNSGENNNSVLVIPDIKGIVFGAEVEWEGKKITAYTIINYKGRELVPLALKSVYSVRNEGQDEYMMIDMGDVLYPVKSYYEKNVKPDPSEQETNEITNSMDLNIITSNETVENNTTNDENSEEDENSNEETTPTSTENDTSSTDTIITDDIQL